MTMKQIQIPLGKKAYFASDFHLGFPSQEDSRVREKHLLAWLDLVEQDGSDLFLLGDLFDFWFEYSEVIPKGFVRFIGRLAHLSDQGVRIHIFVGNHDLWMADYFEREISAKIYREPTEFQFSTSEKSYRVLLGHGDGIGPGDYGYKFLKRIFTNPMARWFFKVLHPDLGIRLAHVWSNTRKSNTIQAGEVPFNPETDFILSYVRERYQQDAQQHLACDAYVFGHRHHPIEFALDGHSSYFNLGDWFSPQFKNAYYLTIDEKRIEFLHFPRN
jgi:UDP-2,3-diacylglucosamine hydrolase